MPEIYALSDLTVNASLTMGNVGRTVVESLAMDKPVLATSYEGLVNLVQDGLNGYIIATKNPQDLAEKICLAKQTAFTDIRNRLNPEYISADNGRENAGGIQEASTRKAIFMKVLHLPTEIAGQVNLSARGLRAIGVDAYNTARPNPYGYAVDIDPRITWLPFLKNTAIPSFFLNG